MECEERQSIAKEWNAIQKPERDNVPEYLSTQLRINDIEAELYGNPTGSKKENLLKEKDELTKKKDELSAKYVEVMCNFIKGRTYNDVLESKLRNIAKRTVFVEKKCRTLAGFLEAMVEYIPAEKVEEYKK